MPLRILAFLIVLLASVEHQDGNHLAGNQVSLSPGSSEGQGKQEIVTVEEPPTSFRKLGQVEISYFAGTDTTEVRTSGPPTVATQCLQACGLNSERKEEV
jgi:hypothetical protein